MNNAVVKKKSNEDSLTDADLYPSRNGKTARLVKRQDPVVYSTNDTDSPLERSYAKQFEQQGFIKLDNVFSMDEVNELLQESARLRSDKNIKQSGETITEPDGNEVRSVFRVHEHSQLIQKISQDERLAGIARYLLDDEIYIHQSRLNYKPGFRGKEFYWHSDFETWHVEDGMPRMRALSMSITLTENLQYNGPLMLIPGSHKQYVVCEGATPENHHLKSLKKQEYGVPPDRCLETLVDKGGVVAATGKPGSVIVFDCNVMHGSNGNITPYPRSNIFFVYNALSNKVVKPFSVQPPRPEHLCTRHKINPISNGKKSL